MTKGERDCARSETCAVSSTTPKARSMGGAESASACSSLWPMASKMVGRNAGSVLYAMLARKNMNAVSQAAGSLKAARTSFDLSLDVDDGGVDVESEKGRPGPPGCCWDFSC